MQNSYSERRSYADSNPVRGNANKGKFYHADQSTPTPGNVHNSRPSAFAGAAAIIIKSGFFVLSIIARGLRGSVRMLLPKASTQQKHDALPHENEL